MTTGTAPEMAVIGPAILPESSIDALADLLIGLFEAEMAEEDSPTYCAAPSLN